MHGILQRCQTSKCMDSLMFFTTCTCTMSGLWLVTRLWYDYFRYGNKGGGVKHGKKLANIVEVSV